MLITLKGSSGLPTLRFTGIVGLSNVVVISYIGTGLLGFVLYIIISSVMIVLASLTVTEETYVSALTSQTTVRRLFGELRVSSFMNGGILAER